MRKTCTQLRLESQSPSQPLEELGAHLRKGAMLVVRGRPCEVVEILPFGPRGRVEHLMHVLYLDGQPPRVEHLLAHKEAGVHPTSMLLLDQALRLPLSSWLERGSEWARDNLIPFPGMAGEPLQCTKQQPSESAAPVSPCRSVPEPDPHQLVGLEKVLSRRSVRLLLADEPGLGKTGQAALIAGELFQRRRAFRILVLCPPGLRNNWRQEMKQFAGLEFDILDHVPKGSSGDPLAPFNQTDRAIVSFHWLKQPSVLQRFLQAQQHSGPQGPWDMLIVDEAHHLVPQRGARSQLHQAAGQLVSWFPHRVFLTATPHSGYTDSLMGLLQLLDPLRFERTASPSPSMRQAMRQVVIRRRLQQIGTGTYLNLSSNMVQIHCTPNGFESAIRKAWLRAAASLVSWAALDAGGAGCVALAVQVLNKRMLSSLPAFESSVEALAQALQASHQSAKSTKGAGLRERLAHVEDDAPPRFGAPARTLAGLALRHGLPLQERIETVREALRCGLSSPEAVAGSRLTIAADWVTRRVHSVPGEKLLLFSEYADTVRAMAWLLEQAGPGADRIAALDSSVGEARRCQVLTRFCDPTDPLCILVTTDVAAEGLNLHTACRCVVHLDLPWNPGRLAQRTGRVLRRGQSREVTNVFVTGDSAEEANFLRRLTTKEATSAADLGPSSTTRQIPPSLRPACAGTRGLLPHSTVGPCSTEPLLATPASSVCQQLVPEGGLEWALRWRRQLGPPSGNPPLRTGCWAMASLPRWSPCASSAALLALVRWLAMDRCESWLLRWALPLWFKVAGWPHNASLGDPVCLSPSSLRLLAAHADHAAHMSGSEPSLDFGTALRDLLQQLNLAIGCLQSKGQQQMRVALRAQHQILVHQQHQTASALVAELPSLPPGRRIDQEVSKIHRERKAITGKGWLFPQDRLAAAHHMRQLEQRAMEAADKAGRLGAVALLDPLHSKEAARLARARCSWLAPPVLVLDAVALLLPATGVGNP